MFKLPWFHRAPASPPVQAAAPAPAVYNIQAPARVSRATPIPGIRIGMWVIADERPGIVNRVLPDGYLEVHLIQPDGSTSLVLPRPASEVRQARISEIPESRRKPNRLAQLGYQP